MKLYTAYSANYDHALSSIQTFNKKYPRFAEFLEVSLAYPQILMLNSL